MSNFNGTGAAVGINSNNNKLGNSLFGGGIGTG